MNTPVAPRERVTFEHVLWLSGCVAAALLAHLPTLPIWVPLAVVAAAGLRLYSAWRGRGAPPRAWRLVVACVSIGLLLTQFRTFNGLPAGTALLSLLAGLKLLETQTRRDIYVVTMIIYFLGVAALLEGESFWLLAYLIGVAWLTTAALLRVTRTAASGGWPATARYSVRLLLQALPVAMIFWLFFPRFAGPLWQLPIDNHSAASGLSDSMSPGDITDLVKSDEIAFRAQFDGATPAPRERYWRGPVLHDFDGHSWRRSWSGSTAPAALATRGTPYHYKVSLEANQHNWIFVLDWPTSWDLPRAVLSSDYMLLQSSPVSKPIDVVATSYAQVSATEPLTESARRRDTRLPTGRNPRTLALARTLRAEHPQDWAYVQAVLAVFHEQAFYYTLKPPLLSDDSVDDFLFSTRRGFCGHYASAFAALMRASGIPSRVVTGYQGGTYNRFADYWIIRQSDAHAWNEVWLEGRGWVRVDPTASIAPARVETELSDLAAGQDAADSRWQRRQPWFANTRLRLDALRRMWRDRILHFDQGSQERLLAFLHVPEPDGQKLVLVLAACLTLVLAWLTWSVRRELRTGPEDPLTRAYAQLCRKLAKAGQPHRDYEPAEAYAARVAAARPDLGPAVIALSRQYSALRYEANPQAQHLTAFRRAVRAFTAKG